MKLLLRILFKGIYNYFRNPEQREFIRLVSRYGDDERYKLQYVTFLNYRFQVPDSLSFIWQFKDIFADKNYRFDTSSRTPLIYDCGANIGLSCIYFKKLFPNANIKAFEADPGIAQVLRNNLNRNNISGVEVISKAVWINSDGINLVLEGADAASIHGSGKKSHVESVRLKDMIDAESSIDMLKMDIEGAEIEVIRDCRNNLQKIKNIFIEYHSYLNDKQYLDEILAILKENKFRYFIKQAADRPTPFIIRTNKNMPAVDLQLNIYAYKSE